MLCTSLLEINRGLGNTRVPQQSTTIIIIQSKRYTVNEQDPRTKRIHSYSLEISKCFLSSIQLKNQLGCSRTTVSRTIIHQSIPESTKMHHKGDQEQSTIRTIYWLTGSGEHTEPSLLKSDEPQKPQSGYLFLQGTHAPQHRGSQ